MKRVLLIILCFILGINLETLAQDSFSPQAPNGTVIEGYLPYVTKKDEVIYSSSHYKISKFDPTIKTNVEGVNSPGARGANQLVIYTPHCGESTGTNEYGYEAIVVGNTVVELSGANSTIPPDGFVISGHGKAKTWITNAVKIGTKVYVDLEHMTVFTYVTSESYLFLATKKLEDTEQMIQFYSQNNPNFNPRFSNMYVEDAKKYIKKARKNPQSVKKNVSLSIEASNDALKSIIPHKPKELKGVWLRPVEKSPFEIRNTVKRLKKLGVNTVFLETFYHGKTIYPSNVMAKYGFVPQNEIFAGFDPLEVWAAECKKEKIKLHIWFETFYVGGDGSNSSPQGILFLNPAWGNKTKKDYASMNASKVATEHNGYFLDPVNPDVRKFLLELMEEIIVTYKPSGINLDYIRYPQAVSEANSWGYTQLARELFQAQYGVDPINISSNEMMLAWANFRRSYVTQMVKSASALCKKHNVYLSAVIFPDRLAALLYKLQDWREWSQLNYLDGVTPLFLTCDARTASRAIKRVAECISSKTDLYAGLFVTFIGGSPDDLIRQIHESRKLDTSGVILFDYAHITSRYTEALSMFFRAKEIMAQNPIAPHPEASDDGKKKTKRNRKLNWIFSFD